MKNLVTTETLSSKTCQDNLSTACSKFAAASTTVTESSIRSCKQSNDPNSYYHMNWKVYAKRIECPKHLTEVTGCKLAPQSLPAANPAVKTPTQAATDSSFKSGYTITTMQDCCMPTCAWQNNNRWPEPVHGRAVQQLLFLQPKRCPADRKGRRYVGSGFNQAGAHPG